MRKYDLFKMPNNIFEAPLTATELRVMAVIYSLRSRSICKGKKYIKINQKAIASICGFKSTATVSKAVDSLCRYGYLRIERFYDDYKKLGSYVYTVPVLRRDYFFVNRRIFKFNLSSAQTRMYLFFCKCSESHSKRFWNSYNDICRSLNLKRSAVIKTISELLAFGLIKKYKIRKKDGSFSDNHYRIIALKPPKYKFGQRKRRCLFAPHIFFKQFVKLSYKIMINHKPKNVNTLFWLRGSPKILGSLYSTHFNTHRERKRFKLYSKYRCNLGRSNFLKNGSREILPVCLFRQRKKVPSNQGLGSAIPRRAEKPHKT